MITRRGPEASQVERENAGWGPHNTMHDTVRNREIAIETPIFVSERVDEMRVNEYTHTYDSDWASVTSAFWKKYCTSHSGS